MNKYTSLFVCLSILIQIITGSVCYAEVQSEVIEYPQVSVQMLENEMSDVMSDMGHPFIIANESAFQKVRSNGFGKDAVITKQYSLIKDEATSFLDEPLIVVDPANTYISKAVEFWNNIMRLAMVYRVEGIEIYAQRAYEQALVFCNMPSWGERQLIDNVQVAFGVAICYDWLYDWLNNEQKQILVNALNEKHLNMMADLYDNPDKTEYKWAFHQHVFGDANHAVMDNSLTFLSAMAISEENIEFYTDIMAHSLKNLEKPFTSLYPDSGTKEGLGYWSFIGPYIARLLITMNNSFGHCFEYNRIPWIVNLSDFPIYAQSNEGAFIWDDVFDFVHVVDPILYTFGVLKNDVTLQKYALENTNVDKTADPVFALMYDPLKEYNTDYVLQNDKFFKSVGIVTMRNDCNAEQQTWCAFSVRGKNGEDMMHMMDCGTLGFDALGERWIANHGREEYYEGYFNSKTRWSYYRTRAESQSCIVINPSLDGGQNLSSNDGIDTFVSSPGSSYAISDLTDTYSGQVNSYKRGVMLCNNRRSFVVQDEINMPEKSKVYSFFNIYNPSSIIFNDDGKTAIITKGNKKLYVTVDCNVDYTFGVMDCEPLPTSPVPPNPNSSNLDYKKLYIYFDNADNINIRVTFTPYLLDAELNFIENTSFVPMSQWQVENNPKAIPVLTGISINGKELESFNSMDRYYDVVGSIHPSSISAYADEEKYKVSVNKRNDGCLYEITVVDKLDSTNINTYVVDLTQQIYVSNPKVTYTHSAYAGIMLPQEFYRLEYSNALSALYFKDEAPENFVKAVLTLSAEPGGYSTSTNMKFCNLPNSIDLNYLSGSNTSITKNTKHNLKASAIGDASVLEQRVKYLEYDITSLIPDNGGEYAFSMFPVCQDNDYIIVASHRNSDVLLRPQIKYYVDTSN